MNKNNIFYFAYGSNMLLERISNRLNHIKKINSGYIENYKLKCTKRSLKDGSGKATIIFEKDSLVWGVVYEINSSQKTKLDRIEGLGKGYNQTTVSVNLSDNSVLNAITYIADENYIDESLIPFDWYKKFILFGAIENDLPKDYIESIRMIRSESS